MSQADDTALALEPPSLRLDGRVVWVTGASRGLGRAIAFALSGLGAQLLLTARSADGLAHVERAVRERGGTVESMAGSVGDAGFLAEAAEHLKERWGRLDVLVNNAGVSPAFVPSERLDDAVWRDVLDINLSGPFACCRAALPLFEAAGGGSVVNVSSIHAVRAHERLIAYAASKGGLEMVTRTLAIEWAARGIRVNAVAPGYLETDMTAGLRASERWRKSLEARIPLGRFARPAEIVPAIAFLASPCSSYITGSTIFVDGGWTAT